MKKKRKKKKKQIGSDEGSDAEESEIENKKKNKSRLRRRRAGSTARSVSDSDKNEDEGRRKKRKGKKRRGSRAATATTEESSFFESRSRKGSKFTTEEEKSTEKSKEITELDLVERMKALIPFTEPDSTRWTKWNLGPLYHFLRKPNVTLVIALVVNVPDADNEKVRAKEEKESPPFPEMLQRLIRICIPDENGISLVTLNQIIPDFTGEQFYFVKQEEVKIDGYNFDDMVLYGNVTEGYLSDLVSIVTYFWTPLLLEEECLAEGVKDEVYTDLNTLSCIGQNTDHFVQSQELLLYFPPEIRGNTKSSELAKNKGFCTRLEETLIFWITKLKEVLIVKELDDTEGWPGPLEEVDFWKSRSKNFSNILHQMRTASMKKLIRILVLSNSSFIVELRTISIEIKEAYNESSSNFHFLQALMDPCHTIFKSKLKQVPIQIQKFLWLVLTIWRNAPYYNTPKRVNGLLRKFSNYLICHIKGRIKVEQLLQGLLVTTTMKKTKNFLKLLVWWKDIFGLTEKTFLEQNVTKETWIFDYDIIFCHVDSMIQRLYNILEICTAQELFGRRVGDSGEIGALPLYPSVKGPYISSVMKNVGEILETKMDSIRECHSLILDVKNVEWHEHMKSFKETIMSVEIIIQNLLEEVFDQMSNLKQRIDLLQLFRKFNSRVVIARQLDKLSIKVYECFEEEILFLRKLFEQKVVTLPYTYTNLAGRGAWALYMKKRIENQLLVLKAGDTCLPKTGFADYIKSEAKSLAESMSSFAVKTYEEWSNSKELLESRDYKSKLDIPLLIRKGREKKNILEVNFDRDLYKHLAEAEIWHRVGRPVPPALLLSVFPIRDKLHDLLENVTLIAKMYNEIIRGLSTDEKLLFQERLLPLEKQIYPCLVEFTWASENTADDVFTEEFVALAREIKRRMKLYREANIKIAGICAKISKKVRVVKIDPKCIYEASEYRSKQNEMIQSQIYGIVKEYKKIAEIIQEFFKFFKSDGSEVKFQWGKYARLIDECFQEALCISLRNSLMTLESFVCCADDRPVFKLEIKLENNILTFQPNLNSLSEMILGTHANVAFALQPLSRISQYLGMGSIKGKYVKLSTFADALLKDEIALEIQERLKFAIERCYSELNLFCERWTPYRDIWELDKTIFLANYEKMYPSIDAYEKDLEKYLEISKVVHGSDSMIHIRFLQVDCSKLKEQIGKESADWFEMIAQNLYRKAKDAIGDVYKFMGGYKVKLAREPQNLEDQMNLFKILQQAKEEGKRKLHLLPGFSVQFALLERFDFKLEPELKDRLENLDDEWRRYQRYLKEVDARLQKSYDQLRDAFLDQADEFKEKIDEIQKQFENEGPFSSGSFDLGQSGTKETYYEHALIYLENILNDLKVMKQEEIELNETLKVFSVVRDKNQNLIELENEIINLIKVWNQVKQWESIWSDWKSVKIRNINKKKLSSEAVKYFQIFKDLTKEFEKRMWPILSETIENIESVEISVKTVDLLRNRTLRDRHWNMIKDLLGIKFDQSPESLNLETVVQLKLHNYLEEITEISLSSGKETAVEKTLDKIKTFWEEEEFILNRRKGIVPFEVQCGPDLQDCLMDHIVSLSAMKGSIYIGHFRDNIEQWLDNLQLVNLVLEKLIHSQEQWLYMERIFQNEEIGKEIPSQAQQFKICSSLWASIVLLITEYKNVIETVKRIEELPEMLENLNEELDGLRKDLTNFLSGKRQDFPRLYFIPDHDLLELLGNSTNFPKLQGIIAKMFKGVHEFVLDAKENFCMIISKEGEILELPVMIDTTQPVEFWLKDFETTLKSTVKLYLETALDDYTSGKGEAEWLLKRNYPGQSCIAVLRIKWTMDSIDAMNQSSSIESASESEGHSDSGVRSLKKSKRRLKKRIERFCSILNGKRDNKEIVQIESGLEQLKIMNAIVVLTHLRDVKDRLYSRKCEDLNSFEWLQYMRFYWEEGNYFVRQGFANLQCGFEYLGNANEIVMTPLTERSFLALTTAISFHFGAYLHGSINVGKKTTIKSLANILGRHIVDLSVSEYTEHSSLSKVITGVVQTGSWLVLQNIDKLSPILISLVSNKLELISHAKREGYERLMLDGFEVNLNPICGIFGVFKNRPRELKNNWTSLKMVMRPVAMIRPESANILQMKLFLSGFENSHVLAKKIDTIFTRAKEIIHCENRCLFSLDGMLTVVEQAVEFKRIFGKRLNEGEAIIKALQNIVSSALTPSETSVFTTIIKENFPDCTPLKAENIEVEETIRSALKALQYQASDVIIRLCLRLYEIIQVYKGVVIVGKTCTGKTVIRKVLREALLSFYQDTEIKEYVINPSAFESSELFGFTEKITNNWKDGILTKIIKTYESDLQCDKNNVRNSSKIVKWIVLDGGMIEEGSTERGIYDLINADGIITLPNTDVINALDEISVFVETDNVSNASPGFISKTGILFVDDQPNQWKLQLKTWMSQIRDAFLKLELSNFVTKLLDKCLQFYKSSILNHFNQTCIHPALVSMFIKFMDAFILQYSNDFGKLTDENKEKCSFLIKQITAFCIVWSIFGNLESEELRIKANAFLKDQESNLFPSKGMVFDYYIDVEKQRWIKWEELSKTYNLENPTSYYIHTSETGRCYYLLDKLRTYSPVLITGAKDAGKTNVVKSLMRTFSPSSHSFLHTKRTPNMQAKSIQTLINSRLEAVSTMVLSPSRGKTLTVFIDDLNDFTFNDGRMNSYCEFLKHLVEHRMWFDRTTGNCLAVSNISVVAALTTHKGEMNSELPPRLQSKFCQINISKPDAFQQRKVFTTILTRKMADFPPQVRSLADDITVASLEVHKVISSTIIPTPNEPLHAFDLCDISRVYDGLLRGNREAQDTKLCLIRLWFHESTRIYFDRLMDSESRQKCMNILSEQLLKHFEQQPKYLFPLNGFSVFGNFVNKNKFYEEIKDEAAVRTLLKPVTNSKTARTTIIFLEAIKQIAKIARVISVQGGHLINCGTECQGRTTLTLLVCRLYKYKPFLMDGLISGKMSLNDAAQTNLLNTLKEMYRSCAIDKQGSCLIFRDEHINDSSLEVISLVTSTVEIPDLYTKEEFSQIKAKILKQTSLKIPRKKREISLLDDSDAAVMDYFVDEVRRNSHVVLCLNPKTPSFCKTIQKYPGLMKTMTVTWFDIWKQESYLEVAQSCLLPNNSTQKNLMFLPETFCGFHNIAFEAGEDANRNCILRFARITPTHLMDFVEMINSLQDEIGKKLKDRQKILKSAMDDIAKVQAKIGSLSEAARKAERKAQASRTECEELWSVIEAQQLDTDAQEKLVNAQSGALEMEEKEYDELAEIVKSEWTDALEEFESSTAILEDLSVEDLTHIRSYYSPPPLISRVLDAVMIMLDREQNWPEAKIQLGNPDFIRNIVEFDKASVSMEKLHSLKKFVQNKEFTPEAVAKYSNGARILCAWILAIEKYGRIYLTQIIPKREKLEESRCSVEEKACALDLSQQKLQLLQENLKELKGIYEAKFELKETREEDLRNCNEILNRATSVLELMQDDLVEWNEELGQLEKKLENLSGNSMLASAYLVYLGPFTKPYRQLIKKRWMHYLHSQNNHEIKISSNWKLEEFLDCPLTGLEMCVKGFQEDDECLVENCLILKRGRLFSLLIDPNNVTGRIISKRNGETGEEKPVTMTKLTKPNLLQEITYHHQRIQGFQNTFGIPEVRSSERKPSAHDEAPPPKTALVTLQQNPNLYPSQIASNFAIINFSLDDKGLVDYISKKIAKLFTFESMDKCQSLYKTLLCEKKHVQDLNERILGLIITCGESILENAEFPETLLKWKGEITEADVKIQEIHKEINDLNAKIRQFCPVAEKFAELYKIIEEISLVHPYQEISLEYFSKLMEKSMQQYFQMQCSDSPTSSPRRDTNDAMKFLKINGYCNVIKDICRGMFINHRYLFALLLGIRKLQKKREDTAVFIKELEILAQIGKVAGSYIDDDLATEEGINYVESTELMLNPNQLELLKKLDGMPAFNGLLESITMSEAESWIVWMKYLEPENKLPGQWNEHLSNFQRLIVISLLRPDRLFTQIEIFTKEQLGDDLSSCIFSPQLLDLKEIYDDAKCINSITTTNNGSIHPILFNFENTKTPNSIDPKTSIMALGKSIKPQQKLYTLQVSQENINLARKMMDDGKRKGYWIYFPNCDLYLEWVWELQDILESCKGDRVHTGFCLWLSTKEISNFSREITRNSIKIVIATGNTLELGLLRLFMKAPGWQGTIMERNRDKYKKLLYGLSYIHCFLLGRHKYSQSEHNSVGKEGFFNDSDFEIASTIVKIFAANFERIPWWALKQMLELHYSNHFSSESEQVQSLIHALVQRIFSEEAVTNPEFRISLSGPVITMPIFDVTSEENIRSNLKMSRNSSSELTTTHKHIQSDCPSSTELNENPEIYGLDQSDGLKKNMSQAKGLLSSLHAILKRKVSNVEFTQNLLKCT